MEIVTLARYNLNQLHQVYNTLIGYTTNQLTSSLDVAEGIMNVMNDFIQDVTEQVNFLNDFMERNPQLERQDRANLRNIVDTYEDIRMNVTQLMGDVDQQITSQYENQENIPPVDYMDLQEYPIGISIIDETRYFEPQSQNEQDDQENTHWIEYDTPTPRQSLMRRRPM